MSTKGNIRYLIGILIICFFTILPWLIQLINTPDGCTATGFFSGGLDYHTYIAKMKWGMEGHWSYPNRYTGENTEPAPLYYFYLFLGHLAGWTGLSLPWVYHLIRGILAGIATVQFWRFLKKYVPVDTKLAFILCLFCSGGYLALADHIFGTGFNADNTEFFLQGRVWLSYLVFPHYFINLIGVLLFFEAYITGRVLLALPGGFLLSLSHPFLLGLFCPVVLITSLFRKDFKHAFNSCFMVSLGALPITLQLYMAMQEYEWLNVWREQTYKPTPPFWKFFIALYGVTGIAGWYGLLKWFKCKNKTIVLWVIWLLLAVIMSYFFPLDNKREFSFFVSIPLGILAAPVLANIVDWLTNKIWFKYTRIIAWNIVLALCLWHTGTIFISSLDQPDNKTIFTGRYITPEYIQAFKMIDETTDSIVLSSPFMGNLIPAYTKSRPYVGHNCETINYNEKCSKAEMFLTGKMPKDKMVSFLKDNDITWVLLDSVTADKDLTGILGKPVLKGDEITLWKLK